MLVNVEKFDGGEDFVKFAKDCELALFDGEKYECRSSTFIFSMIAPNIMTTI